jgi:uncharacterized protein
MKLFFDTSALFKLYQREEGTEELMEFFRKNPINAVYLSEITGIEFSSAVWKKCRKREINENVAQKIIERFDKDSVKFRFVPQDFELRNSAKKLIAKYWSDGLRTLDSIQLASAIIVDDEIERFFTSDKLLSDIAMQEGLKVNL